MDLLSFAIIAFLAIISPGPNVALIVITSIENGAKAGFITVLSVFVSMLAQVIVVIFLLEHLLAISNFLLYIQWFGIAYFLYLAINAIISQHVSMHPSTTQLVGRAFIIALTNPKTLIFFSALFPQFLTGSDSYVSQMSTLALIFLTIALVCDSIYVLFASHLRAKLQDAKKIKILKVSSYLIITGYLVFQNLSGWQ